MTISFEGRVAIVTVSDRSHRGEREDATGPAVAAALGAAGGEVVLTSVVPDDAPAIEAEIVRLADRERIPLVLTAGGTGFAPRDVTPEATRRVIEREAPGLVEHQSRIEKEPVVVAYYASRK